MLTKELKSVNKIWIIFWIKRIPLLSRRGKGIDLIGDMGQNIRNMEVYQPRPGQLYANSG
jgi:hypothetical protein